MLRLLTQTGNELIMLDNVTCLKTNIFKIDEDSEVQSHLIITTAGGNDAIIASYDDLKQADNIFNYILSLYNDPKYNLVVSDIVYRL